MTRRVYVLVQGKVQGVYYRQSCAQEAKRHKVNGYVRNLHSGDVEAVFEGEDSAVQHMINWCKHGPPAARVEHIEVNETTPVGEKSFEVQP